MRRDLAKQLQPLSVLRSDEGDSGDVCSGSRVAGDEPGFIGEGGRRKDDRDRGGRLLGGEGSLGPGGADDVDVELYERPR